MRAGTAAAKGMSEMDAKKRAKLALAAKAKLRNLHMLVVFSSLIILNVIGNRRESKRAQLTQKAQIFTLQSIPYFLRTFPVIPRTFSRWNAISSMFSKWATRFELIKHLEAIL